MFCAHDRKKQRRENIMPFPEYEQMADALLWYIYTNGGVSYSLHPKEIYDPLADFFGLDEEERRRPRPDGYSGSHWENRVQWTRQRLINEGELDGHIRGVWRLTDQGIRRAARIKSRFEGLADDL